MIDAHIDEILDELERYRNALDKIRNRVVPDDNFEAAYWEMILEAEKALYYDGEDKHNGMD